MWSGDGTSGAERLKGNADFYDDYDFRRFIIKYTLMNTV